MTARTVLDGIRQQAEAADAHGVEWSSLPALTDDSVIMHRVYDDEGLPIAECSNPGVATFAAAAPGNIERLAAAIDAVLAEHAPEEIAVHEGFGAEVWCPACRSYFPCPTVAAVEAALTKDGQ